MTRGSDRSGAIFYEEKWREQKREGEGTDRKNSVRAPNGLPRYVRPLYTPSLALTQLQLRREDRVEVVVGRELDKHNMSVASPDVQFSVGPAEFVNMYLHLTAADCPTELHLRSDIN